jgi:ankyrin repeat protein
MSNNNDNGGQPLGLYDLAWRGTVADVKAALNRGAKINAKRRGSGQTPLMAAAQTGKLNIVRELLNRGAHIHARDASGMTPLMHAVSGNRPNVVRELLRRGAKLEHRRPPGFQGVQVSALTGYARHPIRGATPGGLALVAEGYGRRMLTPVRRQHAQNLLAALFRTHVLPEPLVRYIAQLGRLQKRQNGVRTLGRLTAPAARSPNRRSPNRRSPNRSSP